MKMLECKRGGLYAIGFIDPNTVHEVTVREYANDTEDNLLRFLLKQANKEEIFFSLKLRVSVITVLHTFDFVYSMCSLNNLVSYACAASTIFS
jgi:hypothetical protein